MVQSAGFTIVELLVVVVVIGVLAAIVIVSYNGITAQARDAKRSSDLNAVVKALDRYNIDNGGYPSCTGTGPYAVGAALQAGGLSGCVTDELVPTYLNSVPTDPVNSGAQQYLYAVGFRRTGATSFVGDASGNFIIGDKQDTVSSPIYSGWGYANLTLLLGS